jgi:hypothetical protein
MVSAVVFVRQHGPPISLEVAVLRRRRPPHAPPAGEPLPGMNVATVTAKSDRYCFSEAPESKLQRRSRETRFRHMTITALVEAQCWVKKGLGKTPETIAREDYLSAALVKTDNEIQKRLFS